MSAPSYVQTVVTTAADGSAVAYSQSFAGRLSAVRYVKDDFTDGVTFLLETDQTGQVLWSEAAVNASTTRAPRQATHTTAGAAALYAAGGSAVLEPILVCGEAVKITVAGGGDTKSGTFVFVFE